MVPLGSYLVQKRGHVPACPVSQAFMLGSSLGSTWFRHGSTQRSLTESYVFKAVCLGFGLGSTWFPAVAPQTSWFRPGFHLVSCQSLHKRLGFVLGSTWFLFGSETWVRPGDVCLTNIHACFQPWFHLVPTWVHITESHRVVYFANSALVPALVPLGSHMVPHSGISPSKTCFNCFFAILLASGVTRYRLASWFLVHARRLYYVPLLNIFHSHVADLTQEIERAKR